MKMNQDSTMFCINTPSSHEYLFLRHHQKGASLIVVMLILVAVSILGAGGAQIAMMSERGARNERDSQIAMQAAEAALVDAEFDMRGPGTAPRKNIFLYEENFIEDCGTSGASKGLCTQSSQGKPVWLTVDLTSTTNTTVFGEQTGRTLPAGISGIQSVKKPRYIIEALPDSEIFGDKSSGAKKLIYRVTGMGFGPSDEIQSVAQIVFRKD
jgi:type IV pilus assembly protein PilX